MSARQIRERTEKQGHHGEKNERRQDADDERKEQRHGEPLSRHIERNGAFTSKVAHQGFEVRRKRHAVDLRAPQDVEDADHPPLLANIQRKDGRREVGAKIEPTAHQPQLAQDHFELGG